MLKYRTVPFSRYEGRRLGSGTHSKVLATNKWRWPESEPIWVKAGRQVLSNDLSIGLLTHKEAWKVLEEGPWIAEVAETIGKELWEEISRVAVVSKLVWEYVKFRKSLELSCKCSLMLGQLPWSHIPQSPSCRDQSSSFCHRHYGILRTFNCDAQKAIQHCPLDALKTVTLYPLGNSIPSTV